MHTVREKNDKFIWNEGLQPISCDLAVVITQSIKSCQGKCLITKIIIFFAHGSAGQLQTSWAWFQTWDWASGCSRYPLGPVAKPGHALIKNGRSTRWGKVNISCLCLHHICSYPTGQSKILANPNTKVAVCHTPTSLAVGHYGYMAKGVNISPCYRGVKNWHQYSYQL